jgi:putative ABC transport system permease protein
MHGIMLDMRRALRQALLRPGLALTAVLTMALAVASVTSIYALVDGILLRAPDVPAADRLVVVHRVDARLASLSWPDVLALRAERSPLSDIAALMPQWALDWVGQGEPARLQATLIESAYFDVVQVAPVLGRLLQPRDDIVGAPAVAVVSESFWQSQFSADPQILGRRIRLSGVEVEIIGVAPGRADVLGTQPDFWLPIPPFAPWAASSPGSNNFSVIGSVASPESLNGARTQLRSVSARLSRARFGHDEKELSFTPLVEHMTSSYRHGLWMLLGAVVLVLALAIVNVAALLLVRASGRGSEIAVMRALGATQAAIFRQLLCEGLLLGIAGGTLGLIVAVMGLDALKSFAPAELPRLAAVVIDWRVFGCAVGISLFSALSFSVVPALHLGASRSGPGISAQRSVGGRDAQRKLGWFMSIEVALAVVLLGAAAVLGKSYLALSRVDIGFEAEHRASAEFVMPEKGYSGKSAQSTAVTAVVANLQASPGVESAAFITGLPLSSSGSIGHSFVLEGEPPGDESPGARFRPFHGDYIRALGLRLLAGRGVATSDGPESVRVAWVNQEFVKRYLQGRDPLNTRIAWTPGEAADAALGPQWMQIVGIVGDVQAETLRDGDAAVVYAPYMQRDDVWIRFGSLIVKVQGNAGDFRQPMQAAVSAFDPAIAIDGFMTLEERARQALSGDRFQLQVASIFGLIAFLLGVQGIFGVIAFAVEQRRAELGVRLALGASPQHAVQLILRWGIGRILFGMAAGLLAALWLLRMLGDLLYAVSPYDVQALGAACFAIAGTCLLAIWLPARRAARIDPIESLRQ